MWCSLQFCAIGVGAAVLECSVPHCSWPGAMDLDYWCAAVHSVRALQVLHSLRGCVIGCSVRSFCRRGPDVTYGEVGRCVARYLRWRVAAFLAPDLGCICIWCIAHQGLTGVPV